MRFIQANNSNIKFFKFGKIRSNVRNKNKCLERLCKTQINIMDKQELLNTINSLSAVVDSLNRAGDKDSIKIVVEKILELIKKI